MDQQFAICSPTTEVPFPGSVRWWCWFCATEVWASPGTSRMIGNGEAQPVCLDCAKGYVAQHPDEPIDVPRHVREELKRQFNLTDAEITASADEWAKNARGF